MHPLFTSDAQIVAATINAAFITVLGSLLASGVGAAVGAWVVLTTLKRQLQSDKTDRAAEATVRYENRLEDSLAEAMHQLASRAVAVEADLEQRLSIATSPVLRTLAILQVGGPSDASLIAAFDICWMRSRGEDEVAVQAIAESTSSLTLGTLQFQANECRQIIHEIRLWRSRKITADDVLELARQRSQRSHKDGQRAAEESAKFYG